MDDNHEDKGGCFQGAILIILGLGGLVAAYYVPFAGIFILILSGFLMWAGFKTMVGDEDDI